MEREKLERRAIALTGALLLALITAVFFGRFAPARVVLLRLVQPSAIALLVASACAGFGFAALTLVRRVFSRFAKLDDSGAEVSLAEALLIGAAVLGTVTGLVALAGAGVPMITFAIVQIAAVAFWLRYWRSLARLRFSIDAKQAMLFGPPAVVAFVAAITPVSSPDELVYKLAVPKAYLLFGKMVEMPLNSDSYFPAAFSMLDFTSLLLSGGIAAKLVRLFVFVAALVVVRRYAARLVGASADVAAALVAWTPAMMIVAGWCWMEWPTVGLTILSIFAWQQFSESPSARSLAVSSLALAGALAGKYTALPWLAVFAVLALWRIRTVPAPSRVRVVAAAFATVLVFGGVFYFRNLVWTGSPVAPFLLAGSPHVEQYRSSMGGWSELIRGFDIFHPGIIDDSLGILLPVAVLLSPFALLRRNRDVVEVFLLSAIQLVALITFAPTSRLMFLPLVPLAILGSGAAARAIKQFHAPAKALSGVVLTIALIGQLLLVVYVFVTGYDFFPYVAGAESEREYIARTRHFAKPYAWIAANTPPDATVLLLAENRSYYLERKYIAAGNLDGPRMEAWLARFPQQEALARELARRGITHVLVNKEWYRVARAGDPPLPMLAKEYVLTVSPKTHELLGVFFRSHARVVYDDPRYTIFALLR